jgi:hypothetical protein
MTEFKYLDPGVYDMPDAQYFDYPAFSNSDLKLVTRSPAHYWAGKRDPNRLPDKDTPARLAGRALHCAVLEPGAFDSRYCSAPADAPKRPTERQINAKKPSEATIESIEFWHEFNQKSQGKEVITHDQYTNWLQTGAHIRNHEELKALLTGGLAEKCVFAVDRETGLNVKCKTDYYTYIDGKHIIVDLKSCDDARGYSFQRNAYTYGYFQQAAFYSDVWQWAGIVPQIDLWIIAAFERDAPNAVKLYEITGQDIEHGRKQYRKALNIAAECERLNAWPSYSTDIEPLHIPSWASV